MTFSVKNYAKFILFFHNKVINKTYSFMMIKQTCPEDIFNDFFHKYLPCNLKMASLIRLKL